MKRDSQSQTSRTRALLAAFLGIMLAVCSGLKAATPSTIEVRGTPFYTVYEPENLGSRHPISDIETDYLGRLVVASGANLVVFDGNSWLTYLANELERRDSLVIFSLSRGSDGQLYCSSNSGLFEVAFDANWNFRLTPIAPTSPGYRSYRKSFTDGDYVYFYAQGNIGRYDTKREVFEVITRDIGMIIGSAATHNQRLYAFGVDGRALMHVEGRTWREIDSDTGDEFREGIRVAANWPGQDLMVAPDNSGLLHLAADKIEIWTSEIHDLDTKRVMAIEPVSNELIATAVDSQGIFLIDSEGQVQQLLSRELDYRFGQVNELKHVGNKTVWAASEETLIRVDFNRPLTDFSLALPFASTFPRIFWHRGVLHVVSDGKLVAAESFDGGAFKSYRRRAESLNSIFNGLSVEEGLLIASAAGVHLLRDDETITPVLEGAYATLLIRNDSEPDFVIAATSSNYQLLVRENGVWSASDQNAPSPSLTFHGKTAKPSEFWLEHGGGHVSKVEIRNGKLESRSFKMDPYFVSQWVNIWPFNDRLIFSGGKSAQFTEWDSRVNRFVPAKEVEFFDLLQDLVPGIARPAMDSKGNVWVPANATHPVIRKDKNGILSVDTAPLSPIKDEILMHAFATSNDVIWFTGENAIYQYDPRFENEQATTPQTSIYALELIKGKRISFSSPNSASEPQLELPFRENSIRIHFTTPTIKNGFSIWHEYQIDGYIDDWTSIPSSSHLDLDNLREGNYQVRIRAVGQDGPISEVSTASLNIIPPLYRSPWAYAGYLLSAVAIAALIVYGTRRLSEEKNRKLQRLVEIRTRELAMANRDLQQMVKRAESATAAKSAFLENVSHEMRTPLNQILGPSELLFSTSNDEDDKETLSLINKAASRMLKMIEKLTSLSENATGVTPLGTTTFELSELIEDLCQTHEAEAAEKQLQLNRHVDPKLPSYWVGDVARIRQSLDILIENALKFTEAGDITIKVTGVSESANHHRLIFEISDTGYGINAKLRERIFEPFVQLPHTTRAKNEGTGVGLAICRQLVASLDGEIEVESIEGLGSVFRIRLPLRTIHSEESKLGSEKIPSQTGNSSRF